MPDLFIAFSLGLFGLVLGSFAGATVWRLRSRQLLYDKAHGEPYDAAELKKLKPLTAQPLSKDRSRCLHCGYELRWYDLIPLVSWLRLKGKCRSCHTPIGWFEPLMEIGTAILLVASYLLWPFELNSGLAIAQLVTWLVACVVMVIAFAYDAKWFLLPDSTTIIMVALGVVSVALGIAQTGDMVGGVLNALGAVGVLSGLYLLLFLVSGGRWVGFGDVKLGVALGLLLGEWPLAVLALFLANFLGTLIVYPMIIAGKLSRKAQIPFGPLLILGTVLAQLVGRPILDWYLRFF